MKTTKTNWLPESYQDVKILYIQVTDKECPRFTHTVYSGEKREACGSISLVTETEAHYGIMIPFFNMKHVTASKEKPIEERILGQVQDAINSATSEDSIVKYCYLFHHKDSSELVAICCDNKLWNQIGFMQYEPLEV